MENNRYTMDMDFLKKLKCKQNQEITDNKKQHKK
jgi:hypothetical protein